MNPSKKFTASLIAAVGSFAMLPLVFVIVWNLLEGDFVFNFSNVVYVALILVAIAVFVTETIALVKLAKGKTLSNVYDIVRLVLNGLLAVLAVVLLVAAIVGVGTFSLSVIVVLFYSYGTIICTGVAAGAAFGFKLKDLLTK